MRKLIMSFAIGLLITGFALAQDKTAVKYANTITVPDMKSKLSVLASDEFGGRETGTEGQKKAAEFLAKFYGDLGLQAPVEGSYYQKFNLYQSDWSGVYVKTKKGLQKNGDTFIFRGNADISKETKITTLFAGKGAESDFEGIDLKDKAVIIMPEGNSNEAVGRARKAGARAVFIASPDDQFKSRLPRLARAFLKSRLRFDEKVEGDENMLFYVSNQMAADLLNTTTAKLEAAMSDNTVKSVKARSVRMKVPKKDIAVPTENMMAFLEGTDLKDEVLVISSHFDHIGQNADGTVINNGADDDGSGTTGVMEIAEAFKQAADEGHRPRRSILFLNVTGEEKGLMGSNYYSSHPIFPLEKTVNNLNIDMIGRVDPAHESDPNYVYVIGSEKLSSHLKVISEFANITYTGLNLDYKFDDPNDTNRIYYRSDHYNFAKHGIPIIFYFNGTHADYHRPTDTIEKIEFELMAKRTKLVFHTAWILANRNDRTPIDREDDMTYNR